METSGPTSGIPPLPAATSRVAAVRWQIGQLLQATVSESNVGKVLLDIGNRQVSAQTSLPLEKGQQLTLQVRSLGEQPVLKIASPLGQSALATAVRLLLPKHGPMTPLLSSMGQLARTPDPPIPPLIAEAVRSAVKHMPGVETVSTQDGLKRALRDSGVFLESQLRLNAGNSSRPLSIDSDFKANLLRLVQLVRNWPGSGGQTAPATPGAAGSTASAGSAAPPTGQAPVPGTVSPPAAATGGTAGETTATQQASPTSPGQAQRAIQAAVAGKPQMDSRSAPVQATGLSGASSVSGGSGTGATPQAAVPSGGLPPPFPGSVPAPQSAVQASLDLLNRLGNLRADLLQQSEAALARMQLSQLAAVPREGERGLLEWLLDLPVRRGDDIDLWSMRLSREAPDQQQKNRQHSQSWSAQLAFDLPGLGPMQAQVQLSNERVSTRFWAEQEQTLPLLREHLHELRQALTEAGLEVADLECQPGPMPATTAVTGTPLINEKV